MKEELKLQTIAKLAQGEKPSSIATELDISPSAVLRLKTQYEDAIRNKTIDELLNFNEAAINQIVSLIAPCQALEEQAGELVGSLTALQKLQTEFVSTATLINSKIKLEIMGLSEFSDLRTATQCLTELQNAFFNNPQTNIQINNSDSGAKAYGDWLGDKPGTIQ